MTINHFFRYFFPIFLIFFFIDLEINLLSFSGEEGERVGAAAVNSDGAHIKKESQEIPLKISDLIFISLFFCLICFVSATKDWKIDYKFWKHYFLVLGFILLTSITIFLNDSMSITQKIVCYLYLIKFFQATLIYVFTFTYIKFGGSIRPIFQGLLITTVIMTFFGFLGSVSWNLGLPLDWSWIIPERIQYFGVLSILSLIWLVFLFKNLPSVELLGLTKNQLLVLFLMTFITILLCDKRTVMLAYVVSIFFLFISSVSLREIRKVVGYGFLVLLFTLPFLGGFLDRSFNANDGITRNLAAGLAPKYVELVKDSSFSDIELTGVDSSITERIVKNLYSVQLVYESPFVGSGYWSSPFAHNFLPDSALFQILVETGILGFLLISLFIFTGWSGSKPPIESSSFKGFNIIYRVGTVFIIIGGLAANTVYTFSLFGLLVLLSCLMRLSQFSLLENKNT